MTALLKFDGAVMILGLLLIKLNRKVFPEPGGPAIANTGVR